MGRVFMYLSFDGSAYHGWQVQPNSSTVQEAVERALSTLFSHPVSITAAGRTDAGVSALMMPVHFDFSDDKDRARLDDGKHSFEEQLKYRLNRILPREIAVNNVLRVTNDAHARFSATSRTYRYYITEQKDPFRYKYRLQVPYSLDFPAMNKAAKTLLGTHDFDCFAKAHPDTKTSICTVTNAEWQKDEDREWHFEITANRFLRNMVRAIVGTLLDVGKGKMAPQDILTILDSRSRSEAGESVKGEALFLTNVTYPCDIFLRKNVHGTIKAI